MNTGPPDCTDDAPRPDHESGSRAQEATPVTDRDPESSQGPPSTAAHGDPDLTRAVEKLETELALSLPALEQRLLRLEAELPTLVRSLLPTGDPRPLVELRGAVEEVQRHLARLRSRFRRLTTLLPGLERDRRERAESFAHLAEGAQRHEQRLEGLEDRLGRISAQLDRLTRSAERETLTLRSHVDRQIALLRERTDRQVEPLRERTDQAARSLEELRDALEESHRTTHGAMADLNGRLDEAARALRETGRGLAELLAAAERERDAIDKLEQSFDAMERRSGEELEDLDRRYEAILDRERRWTILFRIAVAVAFVALLVLILLR